MSIATRKALRIGIAATMATGLALTATPAASAATSFAGSFDWQADFKLLLKSRLWNQNTGSTKITSYANCSTDPGLTSYAIELWKDEFFDKSYGNVSYQCDSAREYTWNNLPAGTYYFMIAKRDGNAIHASGTTYYP